MACEHARAIQLAGEGRWEDAHELVQPWSDRLACLIHGYLHRVEGDLDNAAYWYRRGGEALADNALDEELVRLTEEVQRHAESG